MAKNLIRALTVCRNGWLLLSLSAIPAICSAQDLVDPTKPPAELSLRPGEVFPEPNELSSIIISPIRRAAIINGQTVELGAKVDDVRLIEVNERGVVLQGAKGLQVLTLFPNVQINKKALLSPVEDDVKDSALKEMPVIKPASQTGKKKEAK